MLAFPGVCGSGLTPNSVSPYVTCRSASGNFLAGNVPTTTSAAATCTACSSPSGFICPAGTYGTALTIASMFNEVVCQANSVAKSDGTTCLAAAGYYGANDATGNTVTYTACPTGTTTASGTTTGATTVAGCTDLKAGYALNPGVSSSTWSLLVYTCTRSNYGCSGAAGLFASGPTLTNLGVSQTGSLAFTSATALTGTMATATASSGTAQLISGTCPNGLVVGLSAGAGVWTASDVTKADGTKGSMIADCKDLAVGWAFNPSISTGTTNLTALLSQCTAGSYGCAGVAGFIGAAAAAPWGKTGITIITGACTISSATALASCTVTTAAANSGANI